MWVDLNIQLLQEGVEGFIKSLRQLPKDVRALPVAFFLEGRMKEFRESLPLLLDLKNEALRDRSVCRLTPESNQNKSDTQNKMQINNSIKLLYVDQDIYIYIYTVYAHLKIEMCFYVLCCRHWKELMERTGTSFETNLDSFTLVCYGVAQICKCHR